MDNPQHHLLGSPRCAIRVWLPLANEGGGYPGTARAWPGIDGMPLDCKGKKCCKSKPRCKDCPANKKKKK